MEYSNANFFPLFEDANQTFSFSQPVTQQPPPPTPQPKIINKQQQVTMQQQPPPPQQPVYYPINNNNQPQSVLAEPKSTSFIDKMLARKKDLVKLLVFSLMIAFAISIGYVFQILIKYLKSVDKVVTLKQELAITLMYNILLFVGLWIAKSL